MVGETLFGISLAKLWIFLAALAGALTGVLVQKGHSVWDRLGSFFIGLATTVFVGVPVLEHFGLTATSSQGAAAIYLTASCANYVMPHFIRGVSRRVTALIAPAKDTGGEL